MKFLVEFESALKYRLRYWLNSLATLFFIPLEDAIQHYLAGLFVKSVNYLGVLVNYALIFVSGKIIYDIFSHIESRVSFYFALNKIDVRLVYMSIFDYIIGQTLFNFLDSVIGNLPYIAIMYLFLGKIILTIFVFSILFAILLIPFVIAISLFFIGLALKFRSDFAGLKGVIDFFLYIMIPFYYSLFVLPEPFKTILYYYPPAGLLENLRMLVFLGKLNIVHLLILFIEGLALIPIAYVFFKQIFNLARKKGWVSLV